MPFEIIPHDTRFDFIAKWRYAVVVSALLIASGLAAIPVLGVRWGIDFAGGTEMQVRFAEGVAVDEGAVRDAVGSAGVESPDVVRFGESGQDYLIRFQGAGEEDEERQGQVVDRVTAALGSEVGEVEVERVDFVGPKVGAELRADGTKAMLIAMGLILVYIAFRFSSRFAPGAVIALGHDVLVTSAIWVLLGQPFDLQVLAALLAIIGYSINDTIIIYDRIRETLGVHTAHDLVDVINRAINATLSRTLVTSGTTLIAVLALLALGGSVIFPFAAVMAIGIAVGTYSSIFIAAPVMLLLERRFGASPARAASGKGKAGARGARRKDGRAARA